MPESELKLDISNYLKYLNDSIYDITEGINALVKSLREKHKRWPEVSKKIVLPKLNFIVDVNKNTILLSLGEASPIHMSIVWLVKEHKANSEHLNNFYSQTYHQIVKRYLKSILIPRSMIGLELTLPKGKWANIFKSGKNIPTYVPILDNYASDEEKDAYLLMALADLEELLLKGNDIVPFKDKPDWKTKLGKAVVESTFSLDDYLDDYLDTSPSDYDTNHTGGVISQLSSLNPNILKPVSPPCDCHISLRLDTAIIHLNDNHKWTREQIAEWLDVLIKHGLDLTLNNPASIGN